MVEKQRVAVTGLGVITPIGSTIDLFTENIFNGVIGTGPVRKFDTAPYDVKNGGEVKSFTPDSYFKRLNPYHFDRTIQFAVSATSMALEHANLDVDDILKSRVGVIMGTTMGNQQTLEKHNDKIRNKEHQFDSDYKWYSAPSITGVVASEFGFMGPNMVIPTACAAGNYAIGYASDLIENGKADYMVCGGSDAISRACFTMFARLSAISPDLCKPFDQDRKGMMVAEGAGVLILERLDLAVERGATIYAEIAGYANSCDAHHITAPHPEGDGAVLAMEKALINSSMTYADIDYISAHGTGTKANDQTEGKAIKRIFKEKASEIPISSIKSLLGHTMGAASAIEAVASTLAIYHSRLPVNQNLINLDPELDLNVVCQPQKARVQSVLSNSFAFGGNISTLILKKVNV